MKKGIVIEAGGKWTVVLTPEGEFVKIPAHPHHAEGKEISFHGTAVISDVKKKWKPRLIPSISLIAACLLFIVMVFPLLGGTQAYAAVTIDINPSVELEVDKNTVVIEAHSFNQQGEEILELIDWQDRPLAAVTMDIIKQASQQGYMNEQKRVIITTTFYDEKEVQEAAPELNHVMEEVTQKADEDLTVVLIEGNKQWHDEAVEQKKSPGAYMIVKQAEKQGIDLKEDDVKEVDLERLAPVSGVKVIHPKKAQKNEPSKDNKDKSSGVKKEEQQKDSSPQKQNEDKEVDKQEDKNDRNKESKEDKNVRQEKPVREENPKGQDKNDDRKVNSQVKPKSEQKGSEKGVFQSEDDDDQDDNRNENKVKVENQGPDGPDSHVKKEKDQDNKKDKEKENKKKED